MTQKRHVADVLIRQDPDGSPTIESFAPGQGKEAHLRASVEAFVDSIGEVYLFDEVPSLSYPIKAENIHAAITGGELTHEVIDRVYDRVISEGQEVYLPLLEAVEI